MKKQKTIGIEVKSPKNKCEDKNCPFHGNLKIRGRMFTGKIMSKDTHKTAKVQWKTQVLIKKYERFKTKLSKIKVHNPRCIDASVGDIVKVAETKPISKTKKFVIVEILKNEINNS